MINNKPFLRLFIKMLLLLTMSHSFISCNMTKQVKLVKAKNDHIELGSLVVREGTLKNNVETKGAPLLSARLRVAVNKKQFTPQAKLKFVKRINGTMDSISSPTAYYALELIDDIGYTVAINNDVISREFIKKSKSVGAITKINAVFKGAILTSGITAAFLEKLSDDTMGVVFYKDDKRLDIIPLSKMIIFDYEVSYFCFGKDHKNSVVVMDIVEEGKRCKKPLVRKAAKLNKSKKLIDY